MIRHKMKTILGKELRILAIKTRERLELTQREMGEKLQMSESSYSDIETGRNNCSALTAVLLLSLQEDPKCFISLVNEKLDMWYAREMFQIW